ncbi:hypothetical protein WMF45_50960 [Sorangium sp. So ce448]|uniref:hypothetical protein n=1 Tax=Sorangium sp. So ce448 TaxID=3133314 RepID=UPI003F638122
MLNHHELLKILRSLLCFLVVVSTASTALGQPSADGSPDGQPANATPSACPDNAQLMGGLQKEIESLKMEIGRLNNVVASKDDRIATLERDITIKDGNIGALKHDLRTKDAEISNATGELSSAREQLSQTQQKMVALTAEYKKKVDERNLIQYRYFNDKKLTEAEKQRLLENIRRLSQEINESEAELGTKSKVVEEATRVIEAKDQQLKRVTDDKVEQEKKLTQLSSEKINLEKQLRRAALQYSIPTLCVAILFCVLLAVAIARSSSELKLEKARLLAEYEAIARKARDVMTLNAIDSLLIRELSTTKALVDQARGVLKTCVYGSIAGALLILLCAMISIAAIDANAEEWVRLVGGTLLQVFITLFTPVGLLVSATVAAQNKFKDAVGFCLAADLIYRKPSSAPVTKAA